jgi:hypothetical protein
MIVRWFDFLSIHIKGTAMNRHAFSRLTAGCSMITGLLLLLAAMTASAATPEQISKMIDDIKTGPVIYYTPEAAAYFASLGSYSVSSLSVNKDAAIRSFVATIKLGGTPLAQTKEAVPVLIDVFPKAVHVVEVKQARYAGEGTFEDCVSTYIMSSKNQFMLSSPFLDYNSMSLCDAYFDAPYETEIIDKEVNRSGTITSALFNLKITFTFYAGECALSRITGMSLGHDPAAWRSWWLASSSGTYSSPASANGYPATTGPAVMVPANNFSDIVAGGKYRVILTTGDDFTGTVESRDASSMIFETTEGKPYSFQFSLVQSYQLIQAPPPPVSPQVKTPANASNAEYISYDELALRAAQHPVVDVKIANGSLFRGKLVSIDDDGIKLDVEGSMIPIAKNIVKQIIARPQGAPVPDAVPAAPPKPAGPFDTLWIKNAQTDKYGKAKPDLLYVGTIIDEGDNYVTIKLNEGGSPQKFPREEITRYSRHSAAGDGTDEVARYAKPLSCPNGMVLVDMPFGRAGKPYFKVCVDIYEYPNKAGDFPRSNVSFEEAKKTCAKQGKRLCTSEEWMWACGGQDGLAYPYGKAFEQERCNADTHILGSGGKINCSSPFGAFDMVGNVFEWVTDKAGAPALMGGPYSKCQTVSPSANGDAKPQNGLRCCKSN